MNTIKRLDPNINIWLPYPNFIQSVRALHNTHLHLVGATGIRVLKEIVSGSWSRGEEKPGSLVDMWGSYPYPQNISVKAEIGVELEPLMDMWGSYPHALYRYVLAAHAEYKKRDGPLQPSDWTFNRMRPFIQDDWTEPPFVGHMPLHRAHQAALMSIPPSKYYQDRWEPMAPPSLNQLYWQET